jgi:di/tricarboxylate transporter
MTRAAVLYFDVAMFLRISLSQLTASFAVLTSAVISLFDPFAMEASSAALALTILTIGLWASGIVAEYLTALLFFTIAMLFAIVPADVAFAGFSSGAIWLVFSGLVIGVGVNASGLGERTARSLSGLFGSRYKQIILAILLVTMVLGFVMPSSMGRVVLMMPIAMALAKELGYEKNSSGYIGITLAAGFGCFFIPYGVLPANIPNVVLLGIAEAMYDFSPIYGQWLVLHFPLISAFKMLILWALIVFLFPASSEPKLSIKEKLPMSRTEWRLSCILAVALMGWASDFLHQISPAWIGMAAAMLFMAPGLGNVTPKEFSKINFSVLFYVAAILGLGAMVNHSGLGATLADHLISVLPLSEGQSFLNFIAIALTGVGVGTITGMPGIPIFMTPIAGQLAEGSGFSLQAVLMIQALSFSTPYLIYQAAPLVVAMGIAGVRLADGTKLIIPLAMITLLLILPLDFLWWRWLGWI